MPISTYRASSPPYEFMAKLETEPPQPVAGVERF